MCLAHSFSLISQSCTSGTNNDCCCRHYLWSFIYLNENNATVSQILPNFQNDFKALFDSAIFLLLQVEDSVSEKDIQKWTGGDLVMSFLLCHLTFS